MNVLMASPEVAPFAKTGGLADVAGALPRSISANGVETCIVLPLYSAVKKANVRLKRLDATLSFKVGDKSVSAELFSTHLPGSDVPVYFLGNDHYYDRDHLYGTPNGDYKDNAERFIFYCKGVLELIKRLNLQVNIIHCHDWQSAMIPVYMKTLERQYCADHVKSVLTIHNLAYQGTFWHWDMPLTGLDWKHYNWKELEFYGKINLLKGGLVYADALTTVSKGYAQEIQTKEFGCGLEGVIRERSGDLTGIVNGIDYDTWNPETDTLIPVTYSSADLAGKKQCKTALQKKCRLAVDATIPIIGFVGRLVEQKGVDLFTDVIEQLAKKKIQCVVLGTGEIRYQDMLSRISAKYPGKLSVHLAFNERMAHEIEAGTDMLLMPSRYEPCGLNQLYSLKYGTIPIVRETGGLADTVSDCTDASLKDGSATGFVFKDYDADQCRRTVERAIRFYNDRRKWRRLMKQAMEQDWSWKRSAAEYIELYCRL